MCEGRMGVRGGDGVNPKGGVWLSVLHVFECVLEGMSI